CRKPIRQNQIRTALGLLNHKINIVEIIAAIAITKKNPGDTARDIGQSALASAAIPAVWFVMDLSTGSVCILSGSIGTTVVDHSNLVKSVMTQVIDNACDCLLLVQRWNDDQTRHAHAVGVGTQISWFDRHRAHKP